MENELSLSGLRAQVIHSTQLTTIKLNKKHCKEKETLDDLGGTGGHASRLSGKSCLTL